jgi:hypothetical protein
LGTRDTEFDPQYSDLMKGKRKRMRKEIRTALMEDRPYLEIVLDLENKGIPHNLIISEANEFGKERLRNKNGRIV